MLALHAPHHAAVWSSKRPLLSVEDNAVPNYLPVAVLPYVAVPSEYHFLPSKRYKVTKRVSFSKELSRVVGYGCQ